MTQKHICDLLSFQGSLAAILPFVKKKIIFTVENNFFSYRFKKFNVCRSKAAQREQVLVKAAEWGRGGGSRYRRRRASGFMAPWPRFTGLIDESPTQTEL